MMMSKVKKVFLMAGTLVFSVFMFAGCGSDNQNTEKILRVGTQAAFAPFEYQDETKKEYQGLIWI